MKEIVELSKSQLSTSVAELQATFFKKPNGGMEILMAGPSHFSKELTGSESIQRPAVFAEPFRLCSKLKTPVDQVDGRILIVERGDCTFVDKARKAQEAGAAAVIVTDNVPGTAANDQPMFAMSGDGTDDVGIPVVFLFTEEAKVMKAAIEKNPELEVSDERRKLHCFFDDTGSNCFICFFQISIMQMAGLKTRLEKALKTDETRTEDNVKNEL